MKTLHPALSRAVHKNGFELHLSLNLDSEIKDEDKVASPTFNGSFLLVIRYLLVQGQAVQRSMHAFNDVDAFVFHAESIHKANPCNGS